MGLDADRPRHGLAAPMRTLVGLTVWLIVLTVALLATLAQTLVLIALLPR
jgi:hypothetical protein